MELDIAFASKGKKRLLAAFAPIKKLIHDDERGRIMAESLEEAKKEVLPIAQAQLDEWAEAYYEQGRAGG
jgi:hypothetical protein